MVLSVAASTTIALTVVDPTSKPTRNCCIHSPLKGGFDDGERLGYLCFGHGYPGAPGVCSILFHEVVHMPGELGCRSRKTVPMRELVECVLELRMLIDIRPEFVQCPPGLAEDAIKLRPSLCLGFCERHLHAAVGIDLAFAGSLDGQEDHVFEFVDHP